ncbi:C-C motif chemokine 4-like [Melanotaenia boesemani]|uniref:C-C motif chemokine 4-like n=1 Tax=Melanotaenia boesemani TaxID=1250792 RepID=UPI001C049430|nr:C-C motif chemokine 4-like [Melanotaenia boesemani]
MMMMMMKNPIFLVACVLLLSSLTVLASDNTFGPDKCCFKFVSKPLPKKKVVSYIHTDNLCSMEGVLFKMVRGNEICADPTQSWVKKVMEAVDIQIGRVTSSTPSASE